MHSLPLDKRKIEALAAKARDYNIFPMFFRPEETEHPVSPLLNELINNAYYYISRMSDVEVGELLSGVLKNYAFMIEDEGLDTNAFRREVALYYVVTEVQGIYFAFGNVVKENIDDSKVLRILPELRAKLDKDGLLIIDDCLILHQDGIEYKDYILHYHQLLRRGYTSNPNFDFLRPLANNYRRTKKINSFRIAIDHRRLMAKKHYFMAFEKDTWFGPPFDSSKLDDPRAVGLTKIVRNEDSLFRDIWNNGLERTEFYWNYRNGVKSFEIEEISGIEYQFDSFFFNRYIHSERDIKNKVTRHLDGAVKVYLENNYQDRVNTHIPKEGKCFKKIKLWRIDGNIDLKNWVDLISFFFKSNEMIIEYFNPAEFEEMFELKVRNPEEWKRQQAQLADGS